MGVRFPQRAQCTKRVHRCEALFYLTKKGIEQRKGSENTLFSAEGEHSDTVSEVENRGFSKAKLVHSLERAQI
jgi:hypothetical protein